MRPGDAFLAARQAHRRQALISQTCEAAQSSLRVERGTLLEEPIAPARMSGGAASSGTACVLVREIFRTLYLSFSVAAPKLVRALPAMKPPARM